MKTLLSIFSFAFLSIIIINLMTEGASKLPGHLDEMPGNKIWKAESNYQRLEYLGGTTYENLVRAESRHMLNSLETSGHIVMPTVLQKEHAEQELSKIFWYSYWMKKDYIINTFWTQCIFKTLDKQKIFNSTEFKYDYISNKYL